jgi:crotonobetainyl-CoA:carnitine CoA-transferase CaiB-like acyl-CoA transferase
MGWPARPHGSLLAMQPPLQPPLHGYRIIDLTMNMSGPLGTMVLADQGADVIKVEPPGGEVIRKVGMGRGGTTAYFANLNRNKRSIIIDLAQDRGRKVLRTLIDGADAVVQNFRLGVAERLGLSAGELRSGRPELVYLSITGFGPQGPMAAAPAYDHTVQALSGMAARQADPRGGEPDLVRHGIVDKATAYTAAQALTAAFLARERTGQGRTIEISMLDVALNFMWPDGMMNHTTLDDIPQVPAVASSFRLTKTADGYVSVVTLTDRQWQGLLAASGVVLDERAGTVEGRMKHGGETMRAVKKRLAELTTDEVVARMAANAVPCAPVVGLGDVHTHPQVVASGVLEEVDHPVLGRLRQPRPAAALGSPDRRPAPAAGEHTDAILAEAGFTAEQIGELRRSAVVA